MATPKKNKIATKAELPITDKRSKAYRNSQKSKSTKKTGAILKFEKLSPLESGWSEPVAGRTGNETATVQETPWTINNIIGGIRDYLAKMKALNNQLTGCVNSVVYIERSTDDMKEKLTKRSDTVTDNLDDIKWQLKEISETYYNELDILERYIGNTNKA